MNRHAANAHTHTYVYVQVILTSTGTCMCGLWRGAQHWPGASADAVHPLDQGTCVSALRRKLRPAPRLFLQFGEPTGKHACTCMHTVSSRLLLTLSRPAGQDLHLHHLDKAGFVPTVMPVTLATEGHSVLWALAPLMVSWPDCGSQAQSPELPVETHAQRSLWPFQCVTTGLCAPRALTIQ